MLLVLLDTLRTHDNLDIVHLVFNFASLLEPVYIEGIPKCFKPDCLEALLMDIGELLFCGRV